MKGRNMYVKEIFQKEEIFPYINSDKEFIYEEKTIGTTSIRLKTFSKSCKCIECGLEGTFFKLESSAKDDTPHFNLYGISEFGNDVLFTKDHIIPKSVGGADSIENMQTMCAVCNNKKGNSYTEDHLKNGKFRKGITKPIENIKAFKNEVLDRDKSMSLRVLLKEKNVDLAIKKLQKVQKSYRYNPYLEIDKTKELGFYKEVKIVLDFFTSLDLSGISISDHLFIGFPKGLRRLIKNGETIAY
jgi:hypothetical protein